MSKLKKFGGVLKGAAKKVGGVAKGAAGKVGKGAGKVGGAAKDAAKSPKVRGAAGKIAKGAVDVAKNAAPLAGAAVDMITEEAVKKAEQKARKRFLPWVIIGVAVAAAIGAGVALLFV